MARRPSRQKFQLPDKSIEERKKLRRPDRLSYDFFRYTLTALHRSGLTAGCVIVTLHDGSIGSVEFLGGNSLHVGVRPRATLSPATKRMLMQRLDRVTSGLVYDFGSIVLNVNGDCIGPAFFTESVIYWDENNCRNFKEK